MFLYGAAVLVLLINANVGEANESATTAAVGAKRQRSFDKGELAKLIHQVVAAEDDAGETFDDDNNIRQVTKLYGAADPLDFGYFDITTGGLKSGKQDIDNLVNKIYANGAALSPRDSGYSVRFHFIKNPEVLEQYKKNLIEKHKSTSSSSSSYDDSLEYYRKVKSVVRRNAVFRLGNPLEDAINRENPKLALRNSGGPGFEKRQNSREHERNRHIVHKNDDFTERLVVPFGYPSHDDYNDKKQREKSKINRNKDIFREESAKKDILDNIAKNINKWNDKNDNDNNNYKNRENNGEKKKETYDNDTKKKYSEYGSSYGRPSNLRETKSNGWDSKKADKTPKKDNNWTNWKPKSMEQTDLYKRDKNKGTKAKISEDWDRPENYKWDQRKKSHDYDQPKKTKDWDRPTKNNDYEQPKKTNDYDRVKNDDGWYKPKPTKGILSSPERESKHDYIDIKRFTKEKKKKTTNEWDRVGANSGGGSETVNKKPFVPKISDYYNPGPRIHDNPGRGGKSFGRTSIPFVGKRGIYEEK